MERSAGVTWRLAGSWLLLTLFLGGCASMPGWVPSWMGGKDEKKRTEPVVPRQPVQVAEGPTGLQLAWRKSNASLHDWRGGGEPSEHFEQPARFVVTDGEAYVGTFQGRVVKYDLKTGGVAWSVQVGSSVMGGVAVDEERVFAGTEQGEMIALKRSNGELVWRTRVATTVDSAPAVADGKVVFVTLDNRTYALDAVTGKRLWMHSTTAEALVVMGSATPTIADGLVFVGYSSGEVYVLRLADGNRAWSDNLRVLGGSSELDMMQDVDASVVLSGQHGPQVAPRRAFMANHQGRLVAYFAATGSRIWEKKLSVVRQPLWFQGRLFLADLEGNLVAISADDGVELWRAHITDGMLTTPIIFKDKVVVADNKKNLFTLDPASGRLLGRDPVPGAVMSLPMVDDRGLYLWTNSGELLRYE
ncbi:MAG: PQQ-binding-like beta-propeller repeat protein [Magnetococcales bacterium]|nr:PQQ-binding-like beta-propeller repeat protein [Magnetococcales bacterium]